MESQISCTLIPHYYGGLTEPPSQTYFQHNTCPCFRNTKYIRNTYTPHIKSKKAPQVFSRSFLNVGDESRLLGRTPDLYLPFNQLLNHFPTLPFLYLMFSRHRLFPSSTLLSMHDLPWNPRFRVP